MSYKEMINARRAGLKAEARAILDAATETRRELSQGEQRRFDEITADLRSNGEAADKLDRDESDSKVFDAAMGDLAGKPIDNRSKWKGAQGRSVDAELNKRFRDAILSNSLTPIEIDRSEYRSGYQPGLEKRDTMTSSGGGLVGTTFWNTLQRHLVENSAILAAGATMVESATGETLKVPKSTVNSAAAIVAEGGTIAESDPTLGSASLGGYKYGSLVQISYELARDASFDVAGYLAQETGVALANGAGAHFISGTGASQPTGILNNTTLGVTSGTGVTGAPTADNLIDLYHSVAAPYARSKSAAWLMRNSTLAVVRKLKDSQNRYLFDINAPLGSGADGTLLGRPVYVDPNVPAIALNAKSIVFGDISKYWVRTVGGLRFERDISFAFNQDLITFRALWTADGILVDQTGAVKHFVGAAS